jgi:protein tyrosine/serine phosphatase
MNSRISKRLLLVLLVFIVAVAVYVQYVLAHNNFHVVSGGQVYRSAQMSSGTLARIVRAHGIRTILNLRGADPRPDWYSAEADAAHQMGVHHLDFSLSAGREVSDQEIEAIMDSIRSASKPILIHCNGGADRTGLISALYLYTVEGKTADVASRELTAFYGHIPHLHWRYSIAMDHSYWRYVSNHTAKTTQGLQFLPSFP